MMRNDTDDRTDTGISQVSAISAASGGFGAAMVNALAHSPHSLSPKYFYDEQGSALFDRICEQPEYYPTRTELGLLSAHAADIARHIGADAEIVEFGAGSARKIRFLLDAIEPPLRYLPVDISGPHLRAAAARLQRDYPRFDIQPVVGDYTGTWQLPPRKHRGGRRIGFFPGSTIGNFSPDEALHFLQRAAHGILRGGALLVGADLVKDPAILHAAYNDARGMTAAFNLNVLARAGRDLGADFDLSQFAHSAFYNAPLQRIEMHLVSRRAQQVRVCGRTFGLAEGETLHTENSYKFTIESLRALASRAGFRPGPVWTDPQNLFSLHWLQAPA